jgi:predicted ATP-grasp superfamily ATP-dependent carboligase
MLTSSSGKRISVLLTSASSGGTIAAVRHLGACGLDVRVVASQRLAAAVWSRRATGSYSAPPETEYDQFLNRLLAIGKADPGRILLPTSDETAWLYTANATLLEQHFCVHQPSIPCILQLLDKRLFADTATSAGLAVLPSWDPLNADELAALAPTLPYPILIKPRMHVHRRRNDKGVVVRTANELLQHYQRFVEREQDRPADDILLPDAGRPFLQQFVRVGHEGVQSIAGFIDRTGELFVSRRSRKVFQRTQPLGVGVCYESLPPAPALTNAVYRLCRQVGFFGIFEVEFLWFDGRWVIIDFNPRFYNQMGLDIHRGMPLPLLACLETLGETQTLREAVTTAQTEDKIARTVFSDRFTLRAILAAKAITSRITHEDRQYWLGWTKRNVTHAVDVAADHSDPIPGIIHALSETYLGLKAIPRFMQSGQRTSPVLERTLTKVHS